MSMNPISKIAISSTFSLVDIWDTYNPTYTNLKEINEQEKKFNPAKYIRSEDILHWEEYIAILTGNDNILH